MGDDYYKWTHRPDKYGQLHRLLVKRRLGTITTDHTVTIIPFIDTCDDFVIVPSHINYQQKIYDHYNKYYELSHKVRKGKYSNIHSFLTHIFGESHLSFILDYLQILYLNPTQNLPIILLESTERNTGKSTFGYFISKIFEFNSIAMGIGDLRSEFNSIWTDKLTIVIDETLSKEKDLMEMIKRLSTEKGFVLSNSKGKDKVGVEFFGKFIFISNNEGVALPIERGEKRFAVFKVPTFTSVGKEDDTEILSKLEAEIPAFLYFLKNRTLVHEKKSRMHFDTEVYFTDQLRLYFEGSVGYTAKAIQDLVKDTFEMFPEENQLHLSIANILQELTKAGYLQRTDRQQIKKALESDLGMKPQKKGRYRHFSVSHAEANNGTAYPSIINENNVYYIFEREIFKPDYKNSTKIPNEKEGEMSEQTSFGTQMEHILEQSVF